MQLMYLCGIELNSKSMMTRLQGDKLEVDRLKETTTAWQN